MRLHVLPAAPEGWVPEPSSSVCEATCQPAGSATRGYFDSVTPVEVPADVRADVSTVPRGLVVVALWWLWGGLIAASFWWGSDGRVVPTAFFALLAVSVGLAAVVVRGADE